jgi:hypothetical protein
MKDRREGDQEEIFSAVVEAARRCARLLEALQAPNARILARVAAGEATWERVARERYNAACRAGAERRDNPGPPDAYLDAVAVDADLRAVCDNRWLLGEAVDVLRARLDRLDTIATPYDDLELCIRRSITGPDRSPAELDAGLAEALNHARRAEGWKPARKEDGTLLDRWMKALRDIPIVALAMLTATIVGGVGAFYKELPAEWRAGVAALLDHSPRATEGWAMVGSLDPSDPHRWSRGDVIVVQQSGGLARPYPVREGDIVTPRVDLPEWIVGYAEHGERDRLTAPTLEDVKSPKRNQTGAKYAAGAQFSVAELRVLASPGQDDMVWLRLVPR